MLSFLPSCIPPSIVSHSSVLPQNLAPLLSLAPSINSLSALVLLFILLDIKFTNVILALERTKTMYMQTIKFDIKKISSVFRKALWKKTMVLLLLPHPDSVCECKCEGVVLWGGGAGERDLLFMLHPLNCMHVIVTIKLCFSADILTAFYGFVVFLFLFHSFTFYTCFHNFCKLPISCYDI